MPSSSYAPAVRRADRKRNIHLGAKIVSGWKIVPVRPLRKTRLKKVRFTAPLVKARTEKQFSGVRRRRAVTVLQPPRRRGDEPVRFAVLI